jgi:hypothetical protein
MMNLTAEQFFTGDVVRATGIDNATLQSWQSRGSIPRSRQGIGSGNRRMYSGSVIIMVAITRYLVEGIGMVPSVASKAVWEFCSTTIDGGVMHEEPWACRPRESDVVSLWFRGGKCYHAFRWPDSDDGEMMYVAVRVGALAGKVIAVLDQILAERTGA